MQKVLSLYKPIGTTPLALIKHFRKNNPGYQNARLGYAGRLDPMAEGLLLVLVDEENLKRKEYELLPKIYQFKLLLGIETDTYDTLGIIINVSSTNKTPTQLQQTMQDLRHSLVGKRMQSYPPYSSPRVNGKPLFYWAREGKLNEIKIPSKEIELYSSSIESIATISKQALFELAASRVAAMQGDFRQKETLLSWQQMIAENTTIDYFPVVDCTISCSSGTYIRSIAHEIGKTLGCGGIALQIVRTHVGDYDIADTIKV